MNYWIVKANQSRNEPFSELFQPGKTGNWIAARIIGGFEKGDKVVFWKSGTGLRVIALGEVVNPFKGINGETGKKLFSLKSTTGILESQPNIHDLRKLQLFNNAGFLKAGPADTIFRLTSEQGKYLYDFAAPSQKQNTQIPDIDETAIEGNRKLQTHIKIEREASLRPKKIKNFRAQHGALFCEACGDMMITAIRILGSDEGVFEIHHRKPLNELSETTLTSLEDLAVLCPSCHRLIHRLKPLPTVEKLATTIQKAKPK